ncbi:MAG: hypothetical protein A2Y07_04690 [Planctomycetes bacterium GWF2_50_10]|nr:MAG: hypothetical protein A2Y07_04690 [Planctomycetes bacterium GWF2_50_10]
MRRGVVITICGILLYAGGITRFATAYGSVYFDDGGNHIIGDAAYQNTNVYLDPYTANIPGTHAQVINGGVVNYLGAANNSTIEVDGGAINYGIQASGNSKIVVNGGTVGRIWADIHSLVAVNGGSIDTVNACGNGIAEIRGGAIFSAIHAWNSGKICLYGANFSIGGVELNYGDSLRLYGVIGGPNYGQLTGTITGTLLDGSVLNCQFFVPLSNPDGADIIVIPEPVASVLMVAGILLLRRKR